MTKREKQYMEILESDLKVETQLRDKILLWLHEKHPIVFQEYWDYVLAETIGLIKEGE